MLKTITWTGLVVVLILPPISAVAQTGYGVTPGSPSTSTFDRRWNRANESKDRARASAEYMRQRRTNPHYHHHPATQ
jgi:hypothetical protein